MFTDVRVLGCSIMEFRLQTLRELTDFTESCRQTLDNVFTTLGWKEDYHKFRHVAQEDYAVCPCDGHHKIPKSSLEKHQKMCKLRMLGYTKEEEEEMYEPSFFYEKANIPTVVIDKDLQYNIISQAKANAPRIKEGSTFCQSDYSSAPVEVPQNHKHAICDLTTADRLAVYEYVVAENKRRKSKQSSIENDRDLYVDLTAKLKQEDGSKAPKSHLELIAEMRDYKRRRQSYRAKNVHITKKSYTEVIRDVINVHMEELSRYWQESEASSVDVQDDASSTISARSSVSIRQKHEAKRSASVESRESSRSYRDTEHSRHHRDRSRTPKRKKRKRDKEESSKRKKDK
ncbi:U11/U12 small nuclear ribonucleoprotein 48 kDa protein [Protopterus annectens]|uniref:U11/U12 small nuclear ribonucleoprotein 48 kDa protein n=1 Tax=Protopterus annectens TaxID=7888 RepID=UPI001CFB313D|nr:U11/U12 small nuclear ribonucleoprotein 48 kDa protein [Protopterus annectens]